MGENDADAVVDIQRANKLFDTFAARSSLPFFPLRSYGFIYIAFHAYITSVIANRSLWYYRASRVVWDEWRPNARRRWIHIVWETFTIAIRAFFVSLDHRDGQVTLNRRLIRANESRGIISVNNPVSLFIITYRR